jgi:DNA primase
VSFTFDSDTKERVRAATDLVDLVGTRLELRRQGRNYVAICPWHADRRPSLQINAEKQIWKCWVCDIGGDAFNWVMQDEGLTFPEAMHKLAERAGISLETTSGKFKPRTSPDEKAALFKVMNWASELYHKFLFEEEGGSVARKYLEERGLANDCIKKFAVGLAPDSWSYLLDRSQKEGFSTQLLESAGLIKKNDRGGRYDFFRNRVIFPIRDRDSHTIALGGRVLPGTEAVGGKYINSPETKLFTKSQQLYGLDVASLPIRQLKQAIVMEGYTDVMFAHQCGITNAVAVLGTALGAAHLKILQRQQCDQVVLLLDGDEAGQRRSDEVLELFLGAALDVRVLTLPNGLDPADYLKEFGGEKLRALIATSVDALEFKMRRISTGFDPLLDTHRANAAMEEMLSLLAKVPHSGLLTHESFKMRQDQILSRMARQFGLPEPSLRDRLKSLREKQSRFVGKTDAEQSTKPANRLMRPSDLSPVERELIELIIVSPLVAPVALERVQPEWLQSDAAKQMLDAYQELEFAGHPLDFDNVLIALEDPSLKSLLVTLHEQATAKLSFTRETAENRLRALTFRIGEQQDVLRQQRQIVELGSNKKSEEEKLSLLTDVIRQARLRQGLEDKKPPVPEPVASEIQSSEPASGVTENGQPSP